MQSHKMPCLECQAKLMPSKRGMPKRFCSAACKQTFNNRAMQRGAVLYHLFRVMRRERAEAKRLNVWTEMCRLELAWNDLDEGRKTWKSAAMALADIANNDDNIPSTNIFIK